MEVFDLLYVHLLLELAPDTLFLSCVIFAYLFCCDIADAVIDPVILYGDIIWVLFV